MLDKNILTNINNEIIQLIKEYVLANNILEIKNISDAVFSRDGSNIGINTTLCNIIDIQQLITDNASKYEDDQFDYKNNKLIDGAGLIGIDVLLTIDSGNQKSSQSALSENGYLSLIIYNYLKSIQLHNKWKLYEISMDIPTWFPYHSQNVYTIIEIRGLYEL